MKGWSGADLETLAEAAAMVPVREIADGMMQARRARDAAGNEEAGAGVGGEEDDEDRRSDCENRREQHASRSMEWGEGGVALSIRPVEVGDFERALSRIDSDEEWHHKQQQQHQQYHQQQRSQIPTSFPSPWAVAGEREDTEGDDRHVAASSGDTSGCLECELVNYEHQNYFCQQERQETQGHEAHQGRRLQLQQQLQLHGHQLVRQMRDEPHVRKNKKKKVTP